MVKGTGGIVELATKANGNAPVNGEIKANRTARIADCGT